MARVFLTVLLILLGLGAITAALRSGDDDETPDTLVGDADDAPPAEDDEAAPALVVRGHSGKSIVRQIPKEVYEAAIQPHAGGAIETLARWLNADPKRFLELLDEYIRLHGHLAKNGDDAVPARLAYFTRRLMGPWGKRFPGVPEAAREAVRAGGHPPARLSGLLALLVIDPVPDVTLRPTLQRLAVDVAQVPTVRTLAAHGLLRFGEPTASDDEVLMALLASDAKLELRRLYAILQHLRKRGRAARAFVPLLVARARAMKNPNFQQLGFIQTAIAIDPTHPDVVAYLKEFIDSKNRVLRMHARKTLFAGSTDDMLLLLETSSASVRLAGVGVLMQRGVAGGRLKPHVLAALASSDHNARERSLTFLGKVGADTSEVLPIVAEHLASKEPARWLTAVRVLGTAAQLLGDKEAAIQRLLGVTRLPDAQVRRTAVQSILMHNAQPRLVIEALDGLLRDTEATVRREAVDGLGDLVESHEAARRALEAVRNDTDADVRELVAYWLDGDD